MKYRSNLTENSLHRHRGKQAHSQGNPACHRERKFVKNVHTKQREKENKTRTKYQSKMVQKCNKCTPRMSDISPYEACSFAHRFVGQHEP